MSLISRVFLSSHLLHEVEQVCTRIAVINKGRILESGKVGDLLGGSDAFHIGIDAPAKALEAIGGIDWIRAAQSRTADWMWSLQGAGRHSLIGF